MVLDGSDSLEYGSGVQADYSLPLAEPSPDSPAHASFAEIADYFNPDDMYDSLPRLFLTPAAGVTESFQVEVTAFLDDVVRDGLITSGEVVSPGTTVEFLAFDRVQLGTYFTANATYLGSSISGSISFTSGINLRQLETSAFKVQRLNTSNMSWSDIATVRHSFYEEALWFTTYVDAIQEDIYLRLVVGNSYMQQLSVAINDNENTTMQLSGPRSVVPGSTLSIQVALRDANQNPVIVGYSDIARLTYSKNGPGLDIGNNRLYTDNNGVAYVNILFGSNDTGIQIGRASCRERV
jgi:hypothetical protein